MVRVFFTPFLSLFFLPPRISHSHNTLPLNPTPHSPIHQLTTDEKTSAAATAEQAAVAADTLDAVDTASLRLLLAEMRNVTEEETINRSLINERGVTQAVHLHRLPSGEKEEAQCVVCKHSCWLACVVCPCNVRNVACPRHFQHLCRCDNRRKCFIFWWKVSQLRAIVKELEETVEQLESLEAELKAVEG